MQPTNQPTWPFTTDQLRSTGPYSGSSLECLEAIIQNSFPVLILGTIFVTREVQGDMRAILKTCTDVSYMAFWRRHSCTHRRGQQHNVFAKYSLKSSALHCLVHSKVATIIVKTMEIQCWSFDLGEKSATFV